MNQWRKGLARWRCADTLYLSIPFTWLLPQAQKIAEEFMGPVVAGGPAVQLMGAPWARTPPTCDFDTLSFHNPCATYTSRGCPKMCPWCAVPRIEGKFRELETWKIAPVVCDNNFLAASHAHIEKVIDSLVGFRGVDFQGMDASLLTPWHVEQFQRVKLSKLHMAFDRTSHEPALIKALDLLCSRLPTRKISVYVLLGYKDTLEDALYRLEVIRGWGIRPFPMRYQPLDTLEKNAYVDPAWTERDLLRVMKYYGRLAYYEHIPFEDFDYLGPDRLPLFDGEGP